MDLSYQEKSILGTLLAMLVVYGYYFANALRHAGESEFNGHSIGRLMFAVIAIVVIEIVYHIVLALESKPEPKDERDILIEGKAYRNAYLLLATGASLVIAYAIVVSLVGAVALTRTIITPFLTANLMLLLMVLAELMKLFTQLFYYRRGLR
ncbi:MAG: hypothetical protein ABSD98_10130 [Candidatus Korobacteraceae bacterium]|jgi:hypothetical protein